MSGEAAAFGARLVARRLSAGLSQQELAERSGLSVRTVGGLERGRIRWPHPDSVRRLAEALGLGEDDRAEFIMAAGRRLARGEANRQADPPDGSGPANGSGPADGETHRGHPVPGQLPASVAAFAGRRDELAALTRLLDQPGSVVVAISGMAGAGKTTLALRWAHDVADRFPDGQLHTDLRGFDPLGTPAEPAAVIRGFLGALGVPAERIPPGLEEATALYRSILAGRRVLVVLDNARDEQQVRPLLPGSPRSVTLVTSRRQLTGLMTREGARPVLVDVLPEEEARELVSRRLGRERLAAEPDAVCELVTLCGRLPLALAVATARAASRPGIPLAALAAELRDSKSRLDALEAGDVASSVRAAFSWSYRYLTGPAARMFRLLGVHPGPDISVPAAASLAGAGSTEARESLAELAHAHLVTEHAPGRYSVHDLLRDYAAEQARTHGDEQERQAALTRVLDHYLHTAVAAALQLDPARDPQAHAAPAEGTTPEPVAAHEQAVAWFDAERPGLLEAVRLAGEAGFDTHAYELPTTLMFFFYRRGHWHDLAAAQRTALAAAERLGGVTRRAHAHLYLGRTLNMLPAYQEADVELRQALSLMQESGDHAGQGRCHYALARLAEAQGRWEGALGQARRALADFQAAGRRDGEAESLNMIGWICAHLGRHQQAAGCCQRALALFRELGDPNGEAHTLDSLGYTRRQQGRGDQAIACYQQAISLFRGAGDRPKLAGALVSLGDLQHALGRPGAAATAWREGLTILDELRHPNAAQVTMKLSLDAKTPGGAQDHLSVSP